MKVILLLVAVLALANAASVGIAHLKGTSNDQNIDGTVYFVQLNDTYHWVWVNINGITVNASALHGLHVHQFGDLRDATTAANLAGGHYVGDGIATHACENVSPRHEGDMGNWQATNGSIVGNKTLDLLMTTGGSSIIGKAVVLHQLTDDCVTQPTGNAGTRLAVGVIGVANPAYLPADVVAAAGGAFTTNNAVSADNSTYKAVAVLTPTTASSVLTAAAGVVIFEQDNTTGFITVTGMFTGLPTGKGWGLHIHTFADYYTGTVVNGTAAGGHFDLNGSPHGAPTNSSRHSGDLGNICSYDTSGNSYYQWVMKDGKFSLNGTNNIFGRNIIIHDAYDTMVPTSAFGQRAAQGVIGVLNMSVTNPITIPAAVTLSDPLCAAVAPTPSPAPTAAPTPAPSSGASFVALCYVTLFVLLAVVLF